MVPAYSVSLAASDVAVAQRHQELVGVVGLESQIVRLRTNTGRLAEQSQHTTWRTHPGQQLALVHHRAAQQLDAAANVQAEVGLAARNIALLEHGL